MADVKKLAEELVNLKVTEVNELATILKEEYGIEPAAAAVAVAPVAHNVAFHPRKHPVTSANLLLPDNLCIVHTFPLNRFEFLL